MNRTKFRPTYSLDEAKSLACSGEMVVNGKVRRHLINHFYFMDNDRNDPQNDKGIYYLRTTAEVTVNDAARPSVTQIVNNTVNLCRQETNGSEYDMALWLHD